MSLIVLIKKYGGSVQRIKNMFGMLKLDIELGKTRANVVIVPLLEEEESEKYLVVKDH